MMEPLTRADLIAGWQEELAAMPTAEEIEAWQPKTLEEAIDKVQARGKRRALERLIQARKSAPERGGNE